MSNDHQELAILRYYDRPDTTRALLIVRACRIGRYMTAGHGIVTFELNDDDEFRAAHERLRDFDKRALRDSVTITLRAERVTFDCTLWPYVYLAMSEFDLNLKQVETTPKARIADDRADE